MTDMIKISVRNRKIRYTQNGNSLLGLYCMFKGHELTEDAILAFFECKNHNDTFEFVCQRCGLRLIGSCVLHEEEDLR